MPLTIIDRRAKYDAVRRRLNTLSKRSAHVGVTGRDGKAPHRGANLPVATIATFHEFGTRNIEKRSFIRTTVDAHKAQIGRRMLKVASDGVRGKSIDNGLKKVGDDLAQAMEFRINTGIAPELDEATVRAKDGDTRILRELDQMVEALSARVLKRA